MVKPFPNTELHGKPTIDFLHPGYSVQNVLFSLPRVDSLLHVDPETGENSTLLGIFHHVALLACQIIAGNAFDGYFTLDKEGEQRVADIFLTAEHYYFVPGNNIDGNPRSITCYKFLLTHVFV